MKFLKKQPIKTRVFFKKFNNFQNFFWKIEKNSRIWRNFNFFLHLNFLKNLLVTIVPNKTRVQLFSMKTLDMPIYVYVRPREEASCSLLLSHLNVFLVESLVKEQRDGCTAKNRMKIDTKPYYTTTTLLLYSLHPCTCYHLYIYFWLE